MELSIILKITAVSVALGFGVQLWADLMDPTKYRNKRRLANIASVVLFFAFLLIAYYLYNYENLQP